MSRKTIYFCDGCGKETGNKKHISINFSSNSGIACPPDGSRTSWDVRRKVPMGIMQFCNGTCLGRYFAALMNKKS